LFASIRIATCLSLALLVLSGCGRMRAPDWGSSSGRGADTGGGSSARSSNFKSIQTTEGRSCAITLNGALYCWGDNSSGQIREPFEWAPEPVTNDPSDRPVDPIVILPGPPAPSDSGQKRHILSLTSQSELSHVCYILGWGDNPLARSGDVHCIGYTGGGLLRFGSIEANGKIPAPLGVRFREVKTAEKITCALSNLNQLYCVGTSADAFTSPNTLPAAPIQLSPIGLPPGRTSVLDFAIGSDHICAILDDNGVYCWGSNLNLQLGVSNPPTGAISLAQFSAGSVSKITIPPTSINTFTQVYASGVQTCAIGTDEAIYCWGTTSNQMPTRISPPGFRVKSASLGKDHYCMVYDTVTPSVTGKISCTGTRFEFGQLGIGNKTSPNLTLNPVVNHLGAELTNFTQVSAGQNFTCAVNSANQLWCWGRNDPQFYEMDYGTPNASGYDLAHLARTTNVNRVVAANDFQCVTRTDNLLKCIGYNLLGPSPSPVPAISPVPTISQTIIGPHFFGESPGTPAPTPFLPEVRPLASNGKMTCVSTYESGGGLYCWGTFYDPSHPDVPVEIKSVNPIPIPGLEDGVSNVALGDGHACAIRTGALYCWGNNSSGQVDGNPTRPIIAAPTLLFRNGVSAVATGAAHTCAVVLKNLLCWGRNLEGQVGSDRLVEVISSPLKILDDVTAVAAGRYHTCALVNFTVRCWGFNDSGQLGIGSPPSTLPTVTPTLVGTDPDYDIFEIVAGTKHTCIKAVHKTSADTALFCWGDNSVGQQGASAFSHPRFEAPYRPTGNKLSDTSPIAAFGNITCYSIEHPTVTGQEQLYCMGENSNAQLGNGYPLREPRVDHGAKLVRTFSSSAIVYPAPGEDHVCFSEASVFCLGSNQLGQLGNGNLQSAAVTSPTLLFSNGVTEVVMGSEYTCAIQNRILNCWGYYRNGALLSISPSPDDYIPFSSRAVLPQVDHIAGNDEAMCAQTTHASGPRVVCWGDNTENLLGSSSINSPLNFLNAQLVANLAVDRLIMGTRAACYLASGQLTCWGSNKTEVIGSSNTFGGGPVNPTLLSPTDVIDATVSYTGICYRTLAGNLSCTGGGAAGALSTEVNSLSLTSVTHLSGTNHPGEEGSTLCATTSDGKIYCGGDDPRLLLNPLRANFKHPFGLYHPDAFKLSVSKTHACGELEGVLKCWGTDRSGELGRGTVSELEDFTPAPVSLSP
jgi:alpha-tubulin suppressor-like RCC1 family protein